ncbi:unnamed protein product [Moneuplotes crassus]|uniref:Rab-GAP TBC domain-containing protein n=1 Tax=Euplotes crassus TaxID=5936 RepID=A0AAD2DAU5_EUPCR|nr:unnamed protein product [Moneuplotes crassus]
METHSPFSEEDATSKSLHEHDDAKSENGRDSNPQETKDHIANHKYCVEHQAAQSLDVGVNRRLHSVCNKESQHFIFNQELDLGEYSVESSQKKYKKNEKKLIKILQPNRIKTLSKSERKFISGYLMSKKTNSITEEQRTKLWLVGSGAETLLKDNPGYYHNLLDKVKGYPNPCFSQIHLDLHRTFSTDESFYTKENENTLKRVLSAYVLRNPTIGYCQGLNFIAAVLITQLSEEQAFWVLCQVIESILPTDYFNLMTGVIIDQRVFEELISEYHPDVHKHFKKHEFQMGSLTTQWFVCIFANTLKLNLLKEQFSTLSIFDVWDFTITLGCSGIFKIALSVIGYLKSDILKIKDQGDLFMLFRECAERLPPFKDLNKFLKKFEITPNRIKNLRIAFKEDAYEEFAERHYKQTQSKILRSKTDISSGLEETLKEKFLRKIYLYNGISKLRSQQDWPKDILENFDEEVVAGNSCDTNWPICLYDFFYQNKIQRHFAFKNKKKINIIEHHFGEPSLHADSGEELQFTTVKLEEDKIDSDNGNEIDFDSEGDTEPNKLDGLLLERNIHLCNQENFEEKFKLLFGNKNSEFFIEALQSMYQDSGDISYSEKCNRFISVCSMLAEKVPLYEKGNISKDFFDNLKELEYAQRKSK